MGCDLINKSGKVLHVVIKDYDTGKELINMSTDISKVKRISYDVYGDGVEER